MPISISKAQQQALGDGSLDFLDDLDGVDSNPVRLSITEKVLAQYGAEFLLVMGKLANQRKVVDKGKILSEAKFRMIDDGAAMQIIVPDYYDFPNEGVKGVKSTKNAPRSPYRFKNYGMSAEGRKNIAEYIRSGKARIETVRKGDKAFGIGRESKHKKLLDAQTEGLIYMIKRQGIKATYYFTDAIKETFKDFELTMSEAVGRDIVFTLQKLNRK